MTDNVQGLAIAGGAIAAVLLDVLVEKKIISAEDRNSIFARARGRIGFYRGQPGAGEALKVIDQIVSGLPKNSS